MAEILLPDLSLQWASAGDILKPSDSKIQQGWAPEVPPRQWFNWLDNRQDEAIAHIAQHGISVWSDIIEYQAGKSYVQGSDGIVYKAITTNTNTNPVGNVGDWQSAFLTSDQAVQVATAAQSRAMTANNVYLSPLQLSNAFTGTNQSLSPASGKQLLPGTLKFQWFTATISNPAGQTITIPEAFSTATVFAAAGQITESDANYYFCEVFASTSSTISAVVYTAAPGNAPGPISTGVSVKFLVLGY